MIEPSLFLNELQSVGISNFFGVPDSTLKHFCSYISSALPKEQHTICVNEGTAISVAIGYHLATGRIPAVYMQNSGLGNSVNPLTSLVAKEIYSFPLLLLVGWRGEPGITDEPQHAFQGRITKQTLELLEIPFDVIDANVDVENSLRLCREYFLTNSSPYAFLLRKGTFTKAQSCAAMEGGVKYNLSREDAIEEIIDSAIDRTIFVSTTGMASRELFELRESKQLSHGADFLTVGGMGCASSISLGIARCCPERQIICIDGDGAFLMHMGAVGTIGALSPDNFLHIVINNGQHASTGGQPTIAREIDLCKIASSCGYKNVSRITNLSDLSRFVSGSFGKLCFAEVMTNGSFRSDLGRPTVSPHSNKLTFMRNLE